MDNGATTVLFMQNQYYICAHKDAQANKGHWGICSVNIFISKDSRDIPLL